MRVLLCVASVSPSYGGPAVSVPRLASALAEAGATVGLWVADGTRSQGDDRGGSFTTYGGHFHDAVERLGRPDVLHDNGVWLPHNHRIAAYSRRHGIPRAVSLRGMLEPWAMDHKWLKKAIAWRAYQRRDLLGAAALHTTSRREARNLHRLGLPTPVVTIPNGIDAVAADVVSAAWMRKLGRPADMPRYAVFVGRLYPVKGLPLLLEAWARLRPRGWNLLVAGPSEAGHREQLEAMVAASSLGESVRFLGPVAGNEKARLLLGADLFVLPSHQESFGIAAAEALAHGVPAITTVASPWDALSTAGAGWSVAPSVEGLFAALQEATGLSAQRRCEMGRAAYRLIGEACDWKSVAALFMQLYGELARVSPVASAA